MITAFYRCVTVMQRRLVPERMDAPDLDSREHRQALAGLTRINRFSDASRSIAAAIRDNSSPTEDCRILDLGCGSGDVTVGVARHLRQSGYGVKAVGIDRSPTAIAAAQERIHKIARPDLSIAFHCGDVFRLEAEWPPGEFDVVFCSLFLHHFSQREAVDLVRTARHLSRSLVVIDDLIRCRRGYWLAQLGCRLLSRSPIVHFDGPQSVRAAFTISEAQQICDEAGLKLASSQRHWPLRFLLVAHARG